VFYELIAWATARGYRYLNLGKSTEDEGRALNAGLFRFKEGFGARGVLRETMSRSI
jgi:lipid II:glycine glycyltransferase (peptidoglycan interpeptide bridge formation enzyme)